MIKAKAFSEGGDPLLKFNLPVPHGGLGKRKLEKFDPMISIVQKFR